MTNKSVSAIIFKRKKNWREKKNAINPTGFELRAEKLFGPGIQVSSQSRRFLFF
jgi:hypoxanthine-guanine phosphoribosyltransferase